MRLVYTQTGKPVEIGDRVDICNQPFVVTYFREPHKPDSEAVVTARVAGHPDSTGVEFHVSIIGAEWIEHEDRSPRVFTEADIDTVVGHLTVGADHRELEESFEVAAWYRMHKPTPGVYPITLKRYAYGGFRLIAFDVPCTVTAAYLGTLSSGVAIDQDTSGPREIGKATTRPIDCGFTHKLDELRLPDGATPAGIAS